MSIHPNDNPTPITKSRPKRRAPKITSAMLAVAVIVGLGILAFSSLPGGFDIQATTTGQGNR
ncbi:MAG: hypothetical protein K2Y71_00930 [Xanthobacteraceae bacterium]|nr:hypothetical protein [Xanthobacteraceae bacterium]